MGGRRERGKEGGREREREGGKEGGREVLTLKVILFNPWARVRTFEKWPLSLASVSTRRERPRDVVREGGGGSEEVGGREGGGGEGVDQWRETRAEAAETRALAAGGREGGRGEGGRGREKEKET